jgi:hypothetical protein
MPPKEVTARQVVEPPSTIRSLQAGNRASQERQAADSQAGEDASEDERPLWQVAEQQAARAGQGEIPLYSR